jgi:hypothetical protein
MPYKDHLHFNNASSKSGTRANYTMQNRRRPAMRKEYQKRSINSEYPESRLAADIQKNLNVIAFHEHGAVGPEGRRLLFNIAKRAARRSYSDNQVARERQQHLLRRLNMRFFEDPCSLASKGQYEVFLLSVDLSSSSQRWLCRFLLIMLHDK